MHISFLSYLADPYTQEPLDLSIDSREGDFIIEGSLASQSNRYPIVRSIPRFAGYNHRHNYSKSFGYQWNKWSKVQFESANIGGPMEGHTLKMWERITSINTTDLKEAVIGDFGCGAGRFIEIVRMKKGRAIGIDLSNAVEAAGENFKRDVNVLICQADILAPPLRRDSLDGAFSIGVLHHTPDPRQGFEEMVKTVEPGGWAAVSVYGKGGYYDFPTVSAYRMLFKALWPILGHYPPLYYSYLAAYILRPLSYVPLLGPFVRAVFPLVRLPDVQWSLLDTFDSVTPAYQSAHESYEVCRWFKDCNLIEIEPSNWGFTAYHAVKKSMLPR